MTSARSTPAFGAKALAIVAGNSWWSLSAFLLGIATNLVTLPFVIHRLGVSRFGVAGLGIAICTPFTLVGTSLGQSVAQAVARNRAQENWQGIEDFCGTVAVLGLGVIALTAIVLFAALPPVFRAVDGRYQGLLSLPIFSATLTLGWVAQQMSLVMQGVHVACQSYRRVAAVNAVGAMLLPISIFSIVTRHSTIEGYICALALGYSATAIVWFASLIRDYRWSIVRPRLKGFAARSIVGFTGWQMTAQLLASLAAQADRYLLGAFVGAEAVGYYNTAQRVEEVAYIGVLRAGDALFPHFSATSAIDLGRQADGYLRASWMLNLFAVVVLGPLLPWSRLLLKIWVGSGVASHASLVLSVLSAAGLLGCAGNVFILYSLGVAKTRYSALISAVTALVSSATSIAAISRFGFRAAGFGSLAGMMANSLMMIVLVRHHFGSVCSIKDIVISTILPIAVGLALAAGLSWLHLTSVGNWGNFVMVYAMTSVGLAAAVIGSSALSVRGRRSLGDVRDIGMFFLQLLSRRFARAQD